MAIRKIVTVGGPKEGVLHAKAKRVSRFDEHLERLVADLWETMRQAPGVGLAAPQVGESIRVLVAEYEEQAVALVNPQIIKASEEVVLGTEGCLSIPGFVGDNVERHEAVVVKARTPKGKEIRVRGEGWFARILQHEIDHLDGILYTDRIKPADVRPVREEDLEQAEGAPAKGQEKASDAKANGAKTASAKPHGTRAAAGEKAAEKGERAHAAPGAPKAPEAAAAPGAGSGSAGGSR
jgi:peptide deformylase